MKYEKMSVDTGCVAAVDAAEVEKFGGALPTEKRYSAVVLPNLSRFVPVAEPGLYFVTLKVNGRKAGRSGHVEVRRTKLGACGLFVGDPCYLFDEGWDKYLTSTGIMRKMRDTGIVLELNSDGSYDVTFTVEKSEISVGA